MNPKQVYAIKVSRHTEGRIKLHSYHDSSERTVTGTIEDAIRELKLLGVGIIGVSKGYKDGTQIICDTIKPINRNGR